MLADAVSLDWTFLLTGSNGLIGDGLVGVARDVLGFSDPVPLNVSPAIVHLSMDGKLQSEIGLTYPQPRGRRPSRRSYNFRG